MHDTGDMGDNPSRITASARSHFCGVGPATSGVLAGLETLSAS
jgi:hypothetical protein